ncbi:MAG: serine protease [Rhizonema sp. PD38]|nr:serine protease [Rhizonema sp. PD38]
MKRLVLAVVACIGILGIGLIAKNSLEKHVFAASCRSNQISTTDKLKQQAESITVRVLSGNGGGSGTLIAKQGQVYTVLTNKHVLTSGESYRIQTPDGFVYSADVVKKVNFGVNDLALLQFTSLGSNYAVASLPEKSKLVQETGVLKNLVENEEVFAAGFVDDANGNDQGKPPLKFNTGKITLLLDKSFQGGYRIGYTNDIQKGMSGGPILNSRGELIGINGVNAYPLFGDPYVFEDGSKPNDDLKEKMTRSSWGVPIQTVVQQVPELTATNPVKDIDNIAKNITVLITQQKDPNDNGSGVIIAHQGSTYYILTAKHVLINK